MITRLLIANRGEIARRIIRSAHRLGIYTVAVYSEADRDAVYVQEADEAVFLGPAPASESYLCIDKIIEAAHRTGAQAIHPGYGFLAENPGFAEACVEAGLIFVGPRAEVIRSLGGKIPAKLLAERVGVSVIPGYQGEDQRLDTLVEQAGRVGFPLLIKASAGGGGKGMRIVREPAELEAALEAAQSEAERTFGSRDVLLERYFEQVRHIEVQILGDRHGRVVAFGERECSLQRRYQKLMEEAPSASISDATRAGVLTDAVRLGQAVGYDNAGTVEFIVAPDGQHYFLEVNTRLQVEHPVTEEIWGVDLVEWQLRVAAGEHLTLQPETLTPTGHSIECRILAEDAAAGFLPVAGPVLLHRLPVRTAVRLEAALGATGEISIYYDSMFLKVIATAATRPQALQVMDKALAELVVLGIQTNTAFLRWLLALPEVREARMHTRFVDAVLPDYQRQLAEAGSVPLPVLVAATACHALTLAQRRAVLNELILGWRNNYFRHQFVDFAVQGTAYRCEYRQLTPDHWEVYLNAQTYTLRYPQLQGTALQLEVDGHFQHWTVCIDDSTTIWLHSVRYGTHALPRTPRFPEAERDEAQAGYEARMPGEVTRVYVEPNQRVEKGQPLVAFMSMKMETTLTAHANGVVRTVFVQEKQTFAAKTLLLDFQADA
jgi:acetyl/propionyl-CoA carboxylase alpha subunit